MTTGVGGTIGGGGLTTGVGGGGTGLGVGATLGGVGGLGDFDVGDVLRHAAGAAMPSTAAPAGPAPPAPRFRSTTSPMCVAIGQAIERDEQSREGGSTAAPNHDGRPAESGVPWREATGDARPRLARADGSARLENSIRCDW